MKIVYLGSGEFGIECLNALVRSSHNLRLVVTQPPRAAGRGRKLQPTPVASWADAHLVPFIETADANAPQLLEKVVHYEPDLIVVIAFGQKIGAELINIPPKSAINVHSSLLPKYRGAAPINWAIINGESQTGISIITLADEMDAGRILAQSQTDIGPDETAGQLHDRLAKMAPQMLLKTLNHIADGSATYTDQDHSKATLAPKLKKTDGFLDFNDSAESLRRKILGLWPWPGASAMYISKKEDKAVRVTIAMAEVVRYSKPADLPQGTLDKNLNLICGMDSLKITKIKPAGSAIMEFKDFVNGRRTKPGDMFLKIDKYSAHD